MAELTSPEALWREYAPYVRKLCAYKLASLPFEIDDAVQEIGLAFFAALDRGEEILAPKRWLTIVAMNVINNVYRRHYKEMERLAPDAEAVLPLLPAPEPGEEVSERSLRQCRADFLAGLNADERRLFRLRFVKRKKLAEVGRELGITENNVKQRVFRLKQKAKKYVEQWSETHL